MGTPEERCERNLEKPVRTRLVAGAQRTRPERQLNGRTPVRFSALLAGVPRVGFTGSVQDHVDVPAFHVDGEPVVKVLSR